MPRRQQRTAAFGRAACTRRIPVSDPLRPAVRAILEVGGGFEMRVPSGEAGLHEHVLGPTVRWLLFAQRAAADATRWCAPTVAQNRRCAERSGEVRNGGVSRLVGDDPTRSSSSSPQRQSGSQGQHRDAAFALGVVLRTSVEWQQLTPIRAGRVDGGVVAIRGAGGGVGLAFAHARGVVGSRAGARGDRPGNRRGAGGFGRAGGCRGAGWDRQDAAARGGRSRGERGGRGGLGGPRLGV
jgi:hypothetical protein